MELILPYYQEYINVVASFVEEMGRSHGAGREEATQLRLVGEETFIFIMNGIPKTGLDTMFHLRCVEEEEGLLFLFTNHGRPMNIREIPTFSPDDMERTADGLSLRMIRCFSYDFGYRNLGKEGWELLIRFRVKNYRRLAEVNRVAPDAFAEEQEPVTIREAQPADVPGIISLIYNTYRYSFAKEAFYDEETFARMLAKRKILSIVAVTPSGRVVGHQGVLLESERLGEAGLAMVDPGYRKSRVFLSLVLQTAKAVRAAYPDLLGYAKCVTSHKRSQAFVASFATCYLEPSVYNHASFVGIEGDANARESLIYSVLSMGKAPQYPPVYVPTEHLPLVQAFFAKAKLAVELRDTTASAPEVEETIVRREVNPGRQFVAFRVERFGADFRRAVRRETIFVRKNGVVTANLALPTDRPLPPDIDALLMAEGYFFCGIKPTPAGGWELRYTNLLYQPFDFDRIQLFSADAIALRDYVKALAEKAGE